MDRSGDGNGGGKRPGEPEWFKQERGYTTNAFAGELYNLREDPRETTDLARKRPEVVRDLGGALRRHIQRGGEVPWQPRQTGVKAADHDKLDQS